MIGVGGSVAAARLVHNDQPRPRCATPVTHSQAVLTFCTGGRLHVEQNGRWRLGAGDVLVVPAGAPHRMLDMRNPESWGLGFCVPWFIAHGTASLLAPFERVRDGASAVVQIPGSRHEHLAGLFRELEQVGAHPRGSSDARGAVEQSLLTLILSEVERAGSINEDGRSIGGGVVTDALRYIERHCLSHLTVKDVAKAVGRTPTYVTTALTQATGRSAKKWIVSGRMAEARRLLVHSDEMVDIIAERVGYSDVTHFIRMFRREHGVTPAAWRITQRTPSPAPR